MAHDTRSMKRAIPILIAAGAVTAFSISVLEHARHHCFNMVETLAAIAEHEGVWDNQWDQTKEKLAELRAGLTAERNPQRRFAIQREIANHALYDGDLDAAIATLEAVQREFGN